MKKFNFKKVYIIAEMSCNHLQNFDRAAVIINAAKDAGADAVKLATETPDCLTIDCHSEIFTISGGTPWDGDSFYELYSKTCMDWELQKNLFEVGRNAGIEIFSTPSSPWGVDRLEEVCVPMYKIASFELIDIPLLEKIASTGKPVIMSTGMATLAEIDEAVQTLRNNGCPEIALLKCVSSYPAKAEDMNLRTIPHMAEAFGCVTGLSDHSLDIAVPVAAVALGARIIEKHFTLSRADGGPDAAFSLEPQEFKEMVLAVRSAEKALGKVSYELTEGEKVSKLSRRSLFAVKDIKKGELFTKDNIRSIRPGHGMHPRFFDKVIDKRAGRDLEFGTPLSWNDII